jgi:hypothetical protein
MQFSRELAAIFATASLFSLSPLFAHRMWILPSSTVLSGNEAWVTVDAAVSNTLFVFEHRPLRLEGLVVTGPGGKRLAPQNPSTGQLRSSFDLKLDAPGTYRISLASSSVMASWIDNGEVKRWRGAPEQMDVNVPAQAPQLQVVRMSSRVETYITLGKPDRDALRPAGTGLEILPQTHPSDLTAGEEAVFLVLLNGKPAAGIELTVAHGGGRHIDRPIEHKYRSAADGRVQVAFPVPGFYWLQAISADGESGRSGSRATCVLVVEAHPQ